MAADLGLVGIAVLECLRVRRDYSRGRCRHYLQDLFLLRIPNSVGPVCHAFGDAGAIIAFFGAAVMFLPRFLGVLVLQISDALCK